MTRHLSAALTAVVLACALAACSNSAADSPPDPASTYSAVSSSSTTTGASSAAPSSSRSSVSSAVAAPSPTSANPWSGDLTPEQQAMAQSALTVYQQAWKITDEAYADPTKDWEPTIRKYIADPRASQVLTVIGKFAANQQHTTGNTQVTAVVTAVEGSGDGAKISIDACVDSSAGDLVDATGHSVRAPLSVGPRIKQSGYIYKFAEKDGGWLLSEVSVPDPYEPC